MSETEPERYEATATYSPEDNKIRLYPFARLDSETYARVRAAGFIWAAKQDLFVAPMWTPEREDLALELAGAIDHEESTLEERAEQRADRFDGYQDNRRDDAARAHQAVRTIADGIPFGQPILVGHHSERHARRDAERIESGMRRAVNAWKTAEYWKRRAAGVKSHAAYKARPDVRYRRIKGLESDLRKVIKNIESNDRHYVLWRDLDNDAETTIRRKAGSELPPLTFADRVSFVLGNTHAGTIQLYYDYRDGKIDAAGVRAQRLEQCEAYTVRGARWREHYENRLTYERALLEDSGGYQPPKRASKAELPLLNYPGTVAYRNPYDRSQIVRTEAIPITAAQWKAINVDYKATRISECGTHRVRTAMYVPGTPRDHGINAVYLTDSKTHNRPPVEAIAAKATEERAALDRALEAKTRTLEARNAATAAAAPARAAEAVAAEPYRQMAESLKAGVQTVSAPQLFPTPAELADRLVALADIRAGQKILEPSAGTGRILDAIIRAEHWRRSTVHAVEVHPALARGLHAKYSGPVTVFAPLDFLKLPTGPASSYDRIVMNPPFAKGAALEHLAKARAMLAPGGRVVCVLPGEASRYEGLDPVHVEDLPAGTFEESGTGVRACVVVIE